jgi:hypothetical protein
MDENEEVVVAPVEEVEAEEVAAPEVAPEVVPETLKVGG